jgi:hypothetical protein
VRDCNTYTSADVLGQAFYPLTVGPGSISIAITLGANEPRHLGANLLMILAAAIGCALRAKGGDDLCRTITPAPIGDSRGGNIPCPKQYQIRAEAGTVKVRLSVSADQSAR